MPQQLKRTHSKAGRRGNNEGSIHQRKDGKWCGQVTTGYKTDGKPVRKTVYGKTRNEVASEIAKLTAYVFSNGYTTISSRDGTNFEVLCKEWFGLFIAPGLSSNTEEHRRAMMKNHIFAEFGALDIKNVDLMRLQRFFTSKAKAGLSADYIGKMKNLLNNFFQYALKQHYVITNPMEDVVIHKRVIVTNTNDRALRPEIREDVIAWVMENPILKPIVFVFTLTGLRPQELIAIKWENINFDSKTISVKKAANRTFEFDSDGNVISKSLVIGKTKTPKSVRTLRMPDAAVNALLEWIQYCEQNDIKSDFVFPSTTPPTKGEMRTYTGLRSLIERFREKHGLQSEKITLYTFRHTFATILLEQRENPKIVSELMGHTKVSTTLDLYGTVFDTVYEQTAQTLDGAFTDLCPKEKSAKLAIV